MSEFSRGEYFKDDVVAEPPTEDFETEQPKGSKEEVEFRVVRIEPEDPEVVRKRMGLHAGRMTIGLQRRGKQARKGWS